MRSNRFVAPAMATTAMLAFGAGAATQAAFGSSPRAVATVGLSGAQVEAQLIAVASGHGPADYSLPVTGASCQHGLQRIGDVVECTISGPSFSGHAEGTLVTTGRVTFVLW